MNDYKIPPEFAESWPKIPLPHRQKILASSWGLPKLQQRLEGGGLRPRSAEQELTQALIDAHREPQDIPVAVEAWGAAMARQPDA
ncbi:MAG: hypothetical protein ACO4CG_05920 [Prochlorothrix sp.]